MKPILLIAILILLFSCKKDKLEGDKTVLQGKWKWVSAIEIKTVIATGSSSSTTVLASDFPDTYFMEFERKGKVHFLVNQDEIKDYRVNVTSSSTNCNELSGYCVRMNLQFNGKKDKLMTIYANNDTLILSTTFSHLPLQNRTENTYSYTYTHTLINVN